MKKTGLQFCLLIGTLTVVNAQSIKQPLAFEENQGQVGDQNFQPRTDILFSGTDGTMQFHLKPTGISYQLTRVDSWQKVPDPKFSDSQKRNAQVADQISVYRIDVNWVNANRNSRVVTNNLIHGFNNYYSAVVPDGVTGVKSYESVVYEDIYPGINLKWFAKNDHLKYDYIVSPGADYKLIQFKFDGAESISVNDAGELVIATPFGEIIEHAPLVKQQQSTLPAKWIVNGNVVSYEIDHIDPAQPFVIDPMVRSWGTYYGAGASASRFSFCSTDSLGCVYAAGNTNASTTIATLGAHQITYGGGGWDAILVKFDASGVRLWSTYYGGTGVDLGYHCTNDAAGNIYLTGYTQSASAIATAGTHQPVFGGVYDAYIAKFNANGIRQWGTYFGGGDQDLGGDLSIDASGNFYLSGSARSTSGIATPGAHQTTYGGSSSDAYLAKFNSSCVLQWCTYVGGLGWETGTNDIDSAGNVYLSGYTNSTTGIGTIGTHQTYLSGSPFEDAYLVKFNSNGVRQWGTYYGGPDYDYGAGCSVEPGGNIYVAGQTQSTTGISTPGAHQIVLSGMYDCFVGKFNNNGQLIWGTYYGGANTESPITSMLDGSGKYYFVGYTTSTTDIATVGSYQPTFSGGVGNDVFFVQLNSLGVRQWGTYYGGTAEDRGYGCAIGSNNILYISGDTESSNGIASTGSHQDSLLGNPDAWLAKFIICPTVVSSVAAQSNISCNGGSNGSITVSASGGNSFTYAWTPSVGNSATVTGLTAGQYTCVITNECGESGTVTVTLTEPPALSMTSTQTNNICYSSCNGSASVTVTGGTPPYNYNWNPSVGTSPLATGMCSGTYTCNVMDANFCTTLLSVTITPQNTLALSISASPILCYGGTTTVTVSATGGNPPYSGVGTFTVTAGFYAYTVVESTGCSRTIAINITQPSAISPNQMQNNISCNGGGNGHMMVSPSGGTGPYTYAWSPIANSTNVLNATPAGMYTCTITDANSCTATATFNLTQPPSLVAGNTSGSILCNGQTTTVTITGSGGTPPYSGTGTFTRTAGTYTFTITDANNCIATTTVSLNEPPALNTTTTQIDNNCFMMCNGSSTVTVTGGTPPYSYNWNPSVGNTAIGTGMCAGSYTCIVYDANFCSLTPTVMITSPPSLGVAYNEPMDTVCLTNAPFTLSGASPTGGTFSGPNVSAGVFDPTNATAGNNVVTYSYTDSTGCTEYAYDTIYVDWCLGTTISTLDFEFGVHPNPNNGTFMLEHYSGSGAQVMIYDAHGKLISENILPGKLMQFTIAESGIYLITVISPDGSLSSKRVIVTE